MHDKFSKYILKFLCVFTSFKRMFHTNVSDFKESILYIWVLLLKSLITRNFHKGAKKIFKACHGAHKHRVGQPWSRVSWYFWKFCISFLKKPDLAVEVKFSPNFYILTAFLPAEKKYIIGFIRRSWQ